MNTQNPITVNTTNPLAEMLRTLEQRLQALRIIQQSASTHGFVIKCGAMCIKVTGKDGDRAEACGIDRASSYRYLANAEQVAARITNGAGEKGRAVPYLYALAEELDSCTAALTALRQAASRA